MYYLCYMRIRLLSGVLLVALLVQLSGTGLIYALQRRALYAAQMERITTGRFHHKEKVLLTVQSEDIRWVKPHEFVYQGYMYDVVTMAEVNGSLQIAALKDDREDKVSQAFREHHDQAPVTPRSTPLKILQPQYTLPSTFVWLPTDIPCARMTEEDTHRYCSPYLSVFTPPPEA